MSFETPHKSQRNSCVKSDNLPRVMSLESASVGDEDYVFENETNLGMWS